MTNLPPPASRYPISLQEMSEEERTTYRKWARFGYVCYILLIAGLFAVGISTRQGGTRTATDDQTAGILNSPRMK